MATDSIPNIGSVSAESSLSSWNDAGSKRAIVEFVTEVTAEGGPRYVPPVERIAVFDNDGTLWAEKPMPVDAGGAGVHLEASCGDG
jgi:hypothetical protein